MPVQRLNHAVLFVGDLDRSVAFYTGPLGMKELRRRDVPEGKYTLAFLGYGDGNASNGGEIELTYNYGVETYEQGNAFGHLAVAVPDVRAAAEAVRDGGGFEGVPAVIDKDRSAAIMADQVGASHLIILTAVANVAVNFNTSEQRDLTEITVDEAKQHMADGQFAPGSMLPKVEACVSYVEGGAGRTAIITSLENAGEALNGTVGTSIKS